MITLTTQPSTIVTAQRPIKFVATSDKYAVINLTSVAITDNGSGKCRFTKVGHSLIDGDIIFVTGSVLAAYNVKHEITYVSADIFDSNIDYSINITVSVERNNPNFQMKVEFYHFNNTRVAISSVTDAGGGNIQVTTSTPHGYLATDIISIEDTSTYDGAYIPISIDGLYKFTVTKTYTSSQPGNTRKGEFIMTKAQRYGSNFTFDMSGVAKSLLSYYLPTLSGVLRIEESVDTNIIHFALVFTEQHDNYSGILTEYNTALSNKIQAVDVALQHLETQNLTAFIITNAASTSLRFLTDSPKTLYYQGDEWISLPFITNTTKDLQAKTISYPGAVANTSVVSNVIGGYGVIMIKVVAGSTYMEVYLQNALLTECSETITINIQTKCEDVKRFWFKNRRGALEVFNVFGLEDKANNSQKQSYYRQLESGYATTERGETVIKSVTESQYQLYGQYLTESVAIWLEQLYSSREVYLEESSGLVPVIVTDGNNKSVDKIELQRVNINYQYANKIEL